MRPKRCYRKILNLKSSSLIVLKGLALDKNENFVLPSSSVLKYLILDEDDSLVSPCFYPYMINKNVKLVVEDDIVNEKRG